jgi:hypothetical protein
MSLELLDFSDAPVSIGELRSEKHERANLWTPRDVLIHLLRELDAGRTKIDEIVIFTGCNYPDGGTSSGWLASATNYHSILGLIEDAKFKIMADR